MIDGLEACHNEGVTHRDLKPENFLLDENFNIKIADFRLASAMYKYEDGMLNTVIGTYYYRAPEMHLNELYSGSAVDIFGIAIVLFILYSGVSPFAEATKDDPFYKLIVVKRIDLFWR